MIAPRQAQESANLIRTPLLPEGLDSSDEDQCLEFLDTLSPEDPSATQERLAALFDAMSRKPPSPAARLRVLEAARPALERVQLDLMEGYSQRPTPLGSEADRTLARVVSLWRSVARAYAEVARMGSTDAEVRASIALVCQRCVLFTGRIVVEYFMARREVPAGAWADVHGYYLSAEELGLASVNVAAALGPKARYESCTETYAALLLMDMANPYSRTAQEMGRIFRWTRRFGRALTVNRPKGEDQEAQFGLDLNRDGGVQPARKLTPGHYLRHLGTERLKEALMAVQLRLTDGVSPAELGLGSGFKAQDARRLLSLLNRLWCGAPRARRFPRRLGNGVAELVRGFESVHQLVNGTHTPQPGLRRRSSDRNGTGLDDEHGESWRIVDEAVSGFRLCRRGGGGALVLGDLVGLQLSGSDNKLLCRVNWVMYRCDGALEVGLYVLPGSPQCITVRPADATNEQRWRPAFLLPGLAVLKEEASLVLPQDCFEPLRELDIRCANPFRVRLETIVSQGPNFERVRFKLT